MNRNSLPVSTETEDVPPAIIRGILVLLVGVILIFPLSIWGFLMFILPGIGFLIMGFSLIALGIQMLSKRIKIKCPYCEKTWIVSKRNTASKCPSCKKTGVIKDGHMFPID